MKRTSWNNKIEVKKGTLGEKIVDSFLLERGYVPYKPCEEHSGGHPFDRLCATRDKKRIFIAEAKTKERRIYYEDTGIDFRQYKDYVDIKNKHNLMIFLFFVDYSERCVYGNKLAELDRNTLVHYKRDVISYPMLCKGIIYFPLKNMVPIYKISLEDCEVLKSQTRINPIYLSNIENKDRYFFKSENVFNETEA